MKLATYKDGSRDGQLVVVSRDLSQAHFATGIASRMQQLLDDWNFISPQLEDLSSALNGGKARHAFAHDPRLCMAPLPRAFQWVLNAAGDRSVHQRSGDGFSGPREGAVFSDVADGLWCDAGLAAITGDLAEGSAPAQALEAVRLLTLFGDWSLRAPGQAQGARLHLGCTAFAAVAVTPDELGQAWRGGRAYLTLQVQRGSVPPAGVDASQAMALPFGEWIAQVAERRSLGAGSIVGCVLTATESAAPGDMLQPGDAVRIDAVGPGGDSPFGAIRQAVRLRGDAPA